MLQLIKGQDSAAAFLVEPKAKIKVQHDKDNCLYGAASTGNQKLVKRLENLSQTSQMEKQWNVNLQGANNLGKTPRQKTPQHIAIATTQKKDVSTHVETRGFSEHISCLHRML